MLLLVSCLVFPCSLLCSALLICRPALALPLDPPRRPLSYNSLSCDLLGVSCCDALCPALKPRRVPLAPVLGCRGGVPCVMAGAAVVGSPSCVCSVEGGGSGVPLVGSLSTPPVSPL
jgi:hypothetical protein